MKRLEVSRRGGTSHAMVGPLTLKIVMTAGSGIKSLRADMAGLPAEWLLGRTCGAASYNIDGDGDGDYSFVWRAPSVF